MDITKIQESKSTKYNPEAMVLMFYKTADIDRHKEACSNGDPNIIKCMEGLAKEMVVKYGLESLLELKEFVNFHMHKYTFERCPLVDIATKKELPNHYSMIAPYLSQTL